MNSLIVYLNVVQLLESVWVFCSPPQGHWEWEASLPRTGRPPRHQWRPPPSQRLCLPWVWPGPLMHSFLQKKKIIISHFLVMKWKNVLSTESKIGLTECLHRRATGNRNIWQFLSEIIQIFESSPPLVAWHKFQSDNSLNFKLIISLPSMFLRNTDLMITILTW